MSLWELRKALLSRKGPKPAKYLVPRLWNSGIPGTENVDPYSYYLSIIDEILAKPPAGFDKHPGWTRRAFIYNLFVRTACAFDHDGDGVLGGSDGALTLNSEGVRETGTLLKAVAMLSHIAGLGADTVYLLPVTTIGKANRKGELGSPYAIRNPYHLDENLADPLLPSMSIDSQFAAFCSAAHRMGIKVVLEFVFRTAAQDSDWVREHPEWFYWIGNEIPDRSAGHPDGYGNPPFTAAEMKRIKQAGEDENGMVRTPADVWKALDKGEGELVEPPVSYRRLFTEAPVELAQDSASRWIGTLPSGKKVRIPGAFADWPPDDVQPPWTDVTYLRMYGKPGEDFDYIGYNTIRLYDPALASDAKANHELWDTIARVVPSYQERFGIDGIMIDMGHALPLKLAMDIQARGRQRDPGFAFWEEKFFLDPASADTGYEAVVGPGIFTLSSPEKARSFLYELKSVPVGFFATAENHNTPRLAAAEGGAAWARAAWAIGLFLPGSIPFIHNGIELLEKAPLNTGLGFSAEDLKALAGTKLGLFDRASFCWGRADRSMIDFIASCFSIRRRFADLVCERDPASYHPLDDLPPGVLGYERLEKGRARLAVVCNSSSSPATISLMGSSFDLLCGESFESAVSISPGQTRILQRSDGN